MKTKYLRILAGSVWLGSLAPLWTLAQPVITVQPTNHFANSMSSWVFYVGASGTAPLSYQWLFNGAPIAGGTRYYLSVIGPQPSQWGFYSVIVTNASGSVTSQVAELKIFTAARHSLSGIQAQPDGAMNLTFAGETTAAFAPYYDLYPLESSTNLADWEPVATLQRSNAALEALQFADTNAAPFTQRFYRTATNQLATPVPGLTAPYAVGTFSMVMTDPSRTNTAGRTNYQFMTSFWYPAVSQAGVLPAIYVEPQVALGSSAYNFINQGGPNYGPTVAAFFSHAWSNAPLSTNLTHYPVLLYSPGIPSHRRDNAALAEDLASWGYIVVAMDASDAQVSVFPDGRVVNGPPFTYTMAYLLSVLEGRVRDMQFVLDQLPLLNANEPRLGGRMDLDKVGAFGHSGGAMTIAQLGTQEPRCKALAGLDSGPLSQSNLLTQSLNVPLLEFRTDRPDPDPSIPWSLPDGRADNRLEFFSRQATNAYWLKLASTMHVGFGDLNLIEDPRWLSTFHGMPTTGQYLSPVRACQILRAHLLSFFDKYLKGVDDHLFDGPSPAYPELMQFVSAGIRPSPLSYPKGGLVQGSDGSLYGTTTYGGAYGQGTVFELTTNGVLTTLVSFDGTNGSCPSAALLLAGDGNFYGTTPFGGTNGNHGTVFRLAPSGLLTTLVSFDGTNGSQSFAGLIQGADGNFYGTTAGGGAKNLGTVFRMLPDGALTTLFSFNGANGSAPLSPVVQGTNGNFYGTCSTDISYYRGTVFQMTAAGILTQSVPFTGYNGKNPPAALILGTNGLLYGTTEYGGNFSLNGGFGFGTVFRMTSTGALTSLVSFGGPNGSYCVSSLVQGTDGNFYGTTAGGGRGGTVTGGGTVFKMTPAGALTTLVSFNGANGNSPQAPPIQASDGNFYGTTMYGGPNGGGTVFRVTPDGMLTTLVAFGSQTNSP